MRRSPWLLFVAVFLVVLGWSSGALAHATLRDAVPQPNAQLAQAPDRVELHFNEEVEAQFGAIAVYDQTGARVDKGDAALDPKDVTAVFASLKPLKDGLYTVAYRVISADGHPISGSYGFTVGRGAAGGSYYKPDMPDPNGRPPMGVLIGYWLSAAGLMMLTGLALVQLLVVRTAAGAGFVRWLWAAWGLTLAGTLVLLVSRTAQAAGIGLADALNPALLWRMLQTRTGLAVLARLVLLALTPFLFGRLARRPWLPLAAGALGLLTVAMGGHAVALERPVLTVLLDWIHLLGAAAWAGGLLQLAFLVHPELRELAASERTARLGALVARFSPVAAISVAVLTATGLYPALLHIPSQKALFATTYGQALLVKLGLVAVLLLLGAVNLVIVGPGLRRGQPVGGRLRWVVTAEVAVMVGVLGAATLLTNVAPARAALPPETLNLGIHTAENAVLLQMSPLLPGYRTVNVTVESHDGTPVGPDTQVQLELIMKVHDMGKNVVTGTYIGDGQFRFDQVLIGMPGPWQFVLTIQRPTGEPDTVPVDVQIPEAP